MSAKSVQPEPHAGFVVHVINSLGYGGAERQLSLLAPAMADAGYCQSVIPLVHSQEGNGVTAVKLLPQPDFRPWAIVRALYFSTIRAFQSPGCILIGWMYHSWLIVLLAYLLSGKRSKLFFYCRHGDPGSLSATTRLLAIVLLRIARRIRIPIVFNSQVARSMHQTLVPGISSFVIPNALNPDFRGNASTDRVMGFIGRNHPDKGVDRLIDIVCQLHEKLPDWRFDIAGPGIETLEAELKCRLAECGFDGSRIKVRGAIRDVGTFLEGVAVLFVPSRAESFPNVVVEAMAMGVIPLCTGVGDIPDILGDVVPFASDADGLVELATEICNLSPSETSDLSNALRRRVNKYELMNVAFQHAQVWGSA